MKNFIRPKRENIEAETTFFNKISSDEYDTMTEEVYSYILSEIVPFLNKGEDVLEAGCGTGAFGKRLKKSNPTLNITGIDINSKFIEIAQNTGIYKNILCANLEDKTVFVENCFDVIICPYIIHHFLSIQPIIDNMFYWLKPGGFLIIIDPNGSNFILKLSYLIRIFLSHLVDTSSYASINERHISLAKFKRALVKFQLKQIKPFNNFSTGEKRNIFVLRENINLFPLTFIGTLIYIRKLLFKLYARIPPTKYKGTDIIIMAKK